MGTNARVVRAQSYRDGGKVREVRDGVGTGLRDALETNPRVLIKSEYTEILYKGIGKN